MPQSAHAEPKPVSPPATTHSARITTAIARAADAIASLSLAAHRIEAIGVAIAQTFDGGGRLYTFGNGGSAAEALHMAEELIGKFRDPRPPLPAVCLNADPTALTCIANDFGYDEVFARQVTALATPADCIMAFSTSGNSENITRAMAAGRARGARVIALLGNTGGRALPLADLAVVIPASRTEHIQEAHQVAMHIIIDLIEQTARCAKA